MDPSDSIDTDKRTKVSRACDYCKKRKFKCSGRAPCDLCLKKKMECTFSIVDRRTIRRKNKKRRTKAEKDSSLNAGTYQPVTTTSSTSHAKEFVHKVVKNDQVDRKSLNMLNKLSQLPIHFQPLTMFPVTGKSDESDGSFEKKSELEEGELIEEDDDESGV